MIQPQPEAALPACGCSCSPCQNCERPVTPGMRFARQQRAKLFAMAPADPMPELRTCDASVISHLADPPAMIGPCVLHHGHDGPAHKAANGTSWTAMDRPLGSRLLIDDRTAERRAEQADQPRAAALGQATTPTSDLRLVCRCAPAPESVPDSPTVGSADGPLVAQHRFTVAPHDPDAIRAATERAMQAAADSEKDDALFRKATGDGASVADLLSFPIATHNPQNGQPWERCECGHVEIAHGSRVSCRECLCEQFAIPAAGTTPDSPAADTEPPDGPLVLDRAAATAMRDCLNQLLGDAPADDGARERYAADVECAIGLNVGGGAMGVYSARDAVLAVRDNEMTRLRAELATVEARLQGAYAAAAALRALRRADELVALRAQGRRITSHTYEGPGTCRADLFGKTCGGDKADHELVDEGPQYEQVIAKDAGPTPPVRDRVAARRDPRYAAVLEEIAGFGWPAGEPMVPGSWADTLATRIMTAIRAGEDTDDSARERYAAQILSAIRAYGEGDYDPGTGSDYGDLTAVVLAVRDDELARLREDLSGAQTDRDTTEAAIARVRALAAEMRTWASPHGLANHYADSIEATLDQAQPAGQETPASPCPQHPDAPTIGGMCGGCTRYPADTPAVEPRRQATPPRDICWCGQEIQPGDNHVLCYPGMGDE